MCKIVYLTSRPFNKPANDFKKALAEELRKRKIEVVTDCSFGIFNYFRKRRTYGMAIAFDFYNDDSSGAGLILNKNCSYIGRDFAYNLSNDYDVLTPMIKWRDFQFVDSSNKEWSRYFNNINSSTKAIFYLCTYNNISDREEFYHVYDSVIQLFADEIIRCLRSDYNAEDYRKRVKLAKLKTNKVK